jgi:lambda repressor-like predicted transcriptional regulator
MIFRFNTHYCSGSGRLMLMSHTEFHPEYVKAAIRKRFGSLTNFEIEHGLPPKSVSALLRGAKSRRVARAIDAVMVLEQATVAPKPSEFSSSSRKPARNHRLNAKAA